MDPDTSPTFVVDTLKPTTPLPARGTLTVNSNAIVLSLSEPCADAHFSHYQLKGGQFGETWTDTTKTDDFFFVLALGASNTLAVRGVDQAGNISDPAEVVVVQASML